jgi:sirohydrochlorin ferrochelatase
MRHSRVIPLVAVAHGSADPRSGFTVSSLLTLVRSREPGLDVRLAFLGHAAPSVASVLSGMSGPVVVLPLLLTEAYHSKIDLPFQLRTVRADVRYGPVLGPHPLLISALERAVVSLSLDRSSTGVVLAAAGSSDPSALLPIRELAVAWQIAGGWHSVVPAYASAAAPDVGSAVASLRAVPGVRRVVVATYLLAPGVFADQIRLAGLEAGACAISPALGALPEVADVILERYHATAAGDAIAVEQVS